MAFRSFDQMQFYEQRFLALILALRVPFFVILY